MIRVTGVQVAHTSGDAQELLVVLEAQNPNERALPLLDVSYEITINGTTLFAGTRAAMVTVRGYATQAFVVPAPVARSSPGSSLAGQRCVVRGNVGYLAPIPLATTLHEVDAPPSTAPFSDQLVVEPGEADPSGQALTPRSP